MADYPSYKSPLLIGRSQSRWVQAFGWVYPTFLWIVMIAIAFLAFNHQTLSYFERGEKAIKRIVSHPVTQPLAE